MRWWIYGPLSFPSDNMRLIENKKLQQWVFVEQITCMSILRNKQFRTKSEAVYGIDDEIKCK